MSEQVTNHKITKTWRFIFALAMLTIIMVGAISTPAVANGAEIEQGYTLVRYNYAQTPTFSLNITPASLDVCAPNDAVYNVDVGSILGFTDPVTLSASGHPTGTTINFSVNAVTPPGSSTLTIGDTGSAAVGSYHIDVTGTATADTKIQTVDLNLFDLGPAGPGLLTPSDGAIDVSFKPIFSWTAVPQAASYLLEVATDPGFTNIVYSASEIGTSHTAAVPLSASTLYYWRVTAGNICGAGTSETFSFTIQLATLVCNGSAVDFEDGIPADWTVVDNTGGTGLVWVTTADPACEISNRTNAAGEAACADSDATGYPAIPYDTELVSNPFDLAAWGAAVLDVKAYYRDITTNGNDRFELDVWDGVGWTNELSWDEDHEPEDFSLNLSAYADLSVVQVRFRYFGDGYDWYAQVDDIALTCVPSGPPAIEVDPAALTASQGSNVVSTQPLTITNSGGSPLNWNILEDDTSCDSPTDIPWLSVSPSTGTTVALDSTVVDVSFDSTGMAPGDYSANLCVESDDPSTPLVQVPVTLSVEPPELLECNGAMIQFEDGIPLGWQVVDNTGGTGIVWVTTADPACEVSNRTNGTGEASCADSNAAGSPAIPYDTELWTPLIDLSGQGAVVLDVKAYYHDITTNGNDRFEVDVWDGVGWTNELSWDEDHMPEDFTLNLSAYAGLLDVRVRFRYFGDGYDWYAQVDDIALTCVPSGFPAIEVDPAALTASQGSNIVSTQPMTITNSGSSPLNWNIVEDDTVCDSPTDIPWLSVSPDTGATIALDSTVVDVSFDSTGMAPGDYTANLCVDSDDPVTPLVIVPVDMTVNNFPPEGGINPQSQSPQYSDEIEAVTVSATDNIAELLIVVPSWSSDGVTFIPDLPDFLTLSGSSCNDIGGGMQTCIWTISGVIDLPEGNYTVRVTVSDGFGGETVSDTAIEVLPEDATVAFHDDNPVAVLVANPGGNSGPFSLMIDVTEMYPDLPADLVSGVAPGDISRANVTVTLVPLGSGSSVLGVCTPGVPSGIDYDAVLPVTCDFDDVLVNTYTVQVTVDGGYYTGANEDILMVYDPSLGFTTGGGWFYWPGSEDPSTGYPGDRTNFGYTMKYNKNGANVKGSLLLIRHLPDGSIYRIKSNALYGLALGEDIIIPMGWASFSGKGTYQEPGWSEPIGNYEFIVYVEDLNEPGTGVDRFWIEVFDQDHNIVPDLSISRPADEQAVPIQGGNIVVPH